MSLSEAPENPGRGFTVAIIGAGTIGLSFASLHLSNPSTKVIIYDPRPDLKGYIEEKFPGKYSFQCGD